jgi:hypothetical protein
MMGYFKIMWRVKERTKNVRRGSFVPIYKRDMLGDAI